MFQKMLIFLWKQSGHAKAVNNEVGKMMVNRTFLQNYFTSHNTKVTFNSTKKRLKTF